MTKVIIGVDPHKLSATNEVVDRHEQPLGSGRFSTDQAGYIAMRTTLRAGRPALDDRGIGRCWPIFGPASA